MPNRVSDSFGPYYWVLPGRSCIDRDGFCHMEWRSWSDKDENNLQYVWRKEKLETSLEFVYCVIHCLI